MYRLHDTIDSVLIGLIGLGIAASRTPAMHEGAARALGLATGQGARP